MTRCPCGCPRPVAPGRTYAARGCNVRARWASLTTPEERSQAIRTARARRGITREQLATWGRKGGQQRARLARRAVVERFCHLPVRRAVFEAIKWALAVQRTRNWRQRGKGAAA